MTTHGTAGSWEQRVITAGQQAEAELRHVVQYINDEIVPQVRRSGCDALRASATELHRLAAWLDSAATSDKPHQSSRAGGH